MLLAVPLQISCSVSGDDNGDSTIESTFEGGADVDKNNSGEIKPNGGKDDSNPDETKPDDGNGESNPGETNPDPIKAALEEGVTYKNVDKLMIAVPEWEFSILVTEVTQELYESVIGENPSKCKGEKNFPVECVSWIDATAFCNKLSDRKGLKPCYSYNKITNPDEWGGEVRE